MNKKTLLLVANYHSAVGYAWWLMESYWAKIANHYKECLQTVLAYPRISEVPKIIKSSPIRCVEFNFSGHSISDVLEQCRFLRRNKVAAVYFTDWPTWHWKYAIYKFIGVKTIIIHDHTPGMRMHKKGLYRLLKSAIHKVPCLCADGAFGATDFVAKRLVEINRVPEKKVFSVSNGLPSQNYSVKPKSLHTLFSIHSEKLIIIMVARASRYKNIDFVLKCISSLPQLLRNRIHFVFIGDGPDLSYFIKFATRLCISEVVTFAGKRNDVQSLLLDADIAFHSSSGEVGYSLTILEYMQAGLPVIVPDDSSVCGATIHGMNGMIYPKGDYKTASRLLQILIQDQQLRARFSRQAMLTSRKYDLEKTHKALLNAFNKIIEKGQLFRENARKGTNIACHL